MWFLVFEHFRDCFELQLNVQAKSKSNTNLHHNKIKLSTKQTHINNNLKIHNSHNSHNTIKISFQQFIKSNPIPPNKTIKSKISNKPSKTSISKPLILTNTLSSLSKQTQNLSNQLKLKKILTQQSNPPKPTNLFIQT